MIDNTSPKLKNRRRKKLTNPFNTNSKTKSRSFTYTYPWFSHHATSAIMVSQNQEMVMLLVSQVY